MFALLYHEVDTMQMLITLQERFDSPVRAWANLLDIHAKGKLKRRRHVVNVCTWCCFTKEATTLMHCLHIGLTTWGWSSKPAWQCWATLAMSTSSGYFWLSFRDFEFHPSYLLQPHFAVQKPSHIDLCMLRGRSAGALLFRLYWYGWETHGDETGVLDMHCFSCNSFGSIKQFYGILLKWLHMESTSR